MCFRLGFVKNNCCTAPISFIVDDIYKENQRLSKLELDGSGWVFQPLLTIAGVVFLQSQGLAVSKTIWSHFGYSKLRRSVF